MSKQNQHTPTEINLHKKSKILSIAFSDGKSFQYPCEYLRVYSPAREVQSGELPETGKEQVNIERIEPQGTYAIRIIFDDGHDTGIYSWDTLYEMGMDKDAKWQDYLERLQAAGYTRSGDRTGEDDNQPLKLKVMYFSYLANMLGKESEDVTPPPSVTDIQSLLIWLRKIKIERGYLLADDNVRLTINRQFAEPFSKLEPGDEVGIVPNSPNPPKPPV